MTWFLLLFDKNVSNYLQIPSKYSNIIFSICNIWLKKYSMLKTDEDD